MRYLKEQSHGAYEMFNEIDELTGNLDLMPSVILLCIESLGLDQATHTELECMEIGMNAGKIYDVLSLALNTIAQFKQDRYNVWEEYKKLKPETTETTE